MKTKFLAVLTLLIFIVTGCTVEFEGGLVIDCDGFTATNWGLHNSYSVPINVTILAYDSSGKELINKFVGTIAPGSHTGLSLSEKWTIKPVPGPIVLIGSFSGQGDSRLGNCGNVDVPVTPAYTNPLFTDGRINPDPAATIVGYCRNASLEVYVLNTDKYYKGGALTRAQVDAGLQKATESGNHVLLLESSGQQVWALTSGELQFHSATSQQYDFIFKPTGCG